MTWIKNGDVYEQQGVVQKVNLTELESEIAELRAQLASHQATYDARVALMNASDESLKSIIAETLEALYSPIVMTEGKITEKENLINEINGNHI